MQLVLNTRTGNGNRQSIEKGQDRQHDEKKQHDISFFQSRTFLDGDYFLCLKYFLHPHDAEFGAG